MAVLNRDPSRLRMYERESDGYYHRYQKDAGADPWGMETRSKNIVDVHSTQYPEAKNVESYAKNTNYKLPYFEQEYAHAMGQSFGSFNEFWKLNRTYSMFRADLSGIGQTSHLQPQEKTERHSGLTVETGWMRAPMQMHSVQTVFCLQTTHRPQKPYRCVTIISR